MSGNSGFNNNAQIRKKPRGVNVGQRRGGSRPVPDKSTLQEGIYINERIMHTVASLVGCTAQVRVKNGRLYEGIFRTSSPKFDVVLERAHLVEESSTGMPVIPSHEQVILTLVFKCSDVVVMSFSNVNLDYAVTDGFTDGAISSKCNGQAREKELQPWEGDPSIDDDSMEGIEDTKIDYSLDNEKGWDPNEMFSTNANKFNIKSDYDPSLSQYTTPLHKSDTAEFRQREQKAEQLAMEIEHGVEHSARAAIENGENEELAYSAVQRPSQSQTVGSKYVAPHMRANQPAIVTAQRPQQLTSTAAPSVTSSSVVTVTAVSKEQDSESPRINDL